MPNELDTQTIIIRTQQCNAQTSDCSTGSFMRPAGALEAASTLWINWVILWHDLFSGGVIQRTYVRACASVWVCHCFLMWIRAFCATTSACFHPLSHQDIQARVWQRFFFSSFFSKMAIVTMQCVTEGRPCTCAFYCACESCSFSGSGPKHQTKQVGSQDLCSWFFVLSLTSLYKLFKWLFLFILRAFTMFVINFLNAS